ncbi:MAG: hypothetical protein U9R08_06220 [Nanoarchaeota archaeon]|nr:hypothetical protein [Nanoarchaeota archaeon]
MVRVTQNDIEVSLLGNRDRNRDFHLSHKLSIDYLKLAGLIKNYDLLRGDELIAPGALIIAKLARKFHDEKITGFDIPKIRYPIVVGTDGIELEYWFQEVDGDDFSKKMKVEVKTPSLPKEDGLTEIVTAMSGSVFLHKAGEVNIPLDFFSDKKNSLMGSSDRSVGENNFVLDEVYGSVAGIYCVNQEFPDQFPYKFDITKDTLRQFCQSAGISLKDYHDKFDAYISPMLASFLMVDPMVRFASLSGDKSEALIRDRLKVGPDAEFDKVQLYVGASMCSTDQVHVPLDSVVDVYVAQGDLRSRARDGKGIVNSLFYLMMVDPVSRKPFVAGTFKTQEQYFLKE